MLPKGSRGLLSGHSAHSGRDAASTALAYVYRALYGAQVHRPCGTLRATFRATGDTYDRTLRRTQSPWQLWDTAVSCAAGTAHCSPQHTCDGKRTARRRDACERASEKSEQHSTDIVSSAAPTAYQLQQPIARRRAAYKLTREQKRQHDRCSARRAQDVA
jgi:hypothetical protein